MKGAIVLSYVAGCSASWVARARGDKLEVDWKLLMFGNYLRGGGGQVTPFFFFRFLLVGLK